MDLGRPQQKSSARPIYYGVAAVAALTVLWLVFKPVEPSLPIVTKAVTVLSGDSDVSGTATFTQAHIGEPVSISLDLKGLDPNAKRGFHIHVSGDLSGGCLSASSHFNPFGKNHGAPGDSERHVGDLGNIESDGEGNVKTTFEDKFISLNGPLSIVGRSVVLHAGTDDLGKGGNEESLKTGNAGGRAACGVIGQA
ncbi:Superoxide dismutase [Cu-Zn] [Steccherinum ochraceum]|uniref:Superoxide dismutase [Cu-Zn] n=1 Tax=Steccherinum ochraceum TaxID=92696 RepID=A0A4R0R1L0_9APHY|nr:Superoxide dismutase [Cu-Zn] [Steccherinum ochraceum]